MAECSRKHFCRFTTGYFLKGPAQFIPEPGFFFNRKKPWLSNGPFSASFWSCALRFSEIIGQVLIRSFPGSFWFFHTTTVYKQSVTVDNDCLVNISGQFPGIIVFWLIFWTNLQCISDHTDLFPCILIKESDVCMLKSIYNNISKKFILK